MPKVLDRDPPIAPGVNYAPDWSPAELPIGPDGGLVASMVGSPPAIPAATPANWICLRGPCRHLMHLVSHYDAGNSEASMPQGVRGFRKHDYYCFASAGTCIELEDSLVYECNRWDPEDEDDAAQRDLRRAAFQRRHPEFRVLDEHVLTDDTDEETP